LTISHELYNMGNMTRFLPSFGGYIYAFEDYTLYVSLFVAGHGEVDMGSRTRRSDAK